MVKRSDACMINKKGMTLIEIIVAMALLGIISIGMFSAFSSQFFLLSKSEDITIAAFETQQVIEQQLQGIKSKLANEEPVVVSDYEGVSNASYTLFNGTPFETDVNGYLFDLNVKSIEADPSMTVGVYRTVVADTWIEYPVPELTLDPSIRLYNGSEYLNYAYLDTDSLVVRLDAPIIDDLSIHDTNIYRWYVARKGFFIPGIEEAESEDGRYPLFPANYGNDWTSSGDFDDTYTRVATAYNDLNLEYGNMFIVCTVTPAARSGKIGSTYISNSVMVNGLPYIENLAAHLDASMISKLEVDEIEKISGDYFVSKWVDISTDGDRFAEPLADNNRPILIDDYIADILYDNHAYPSFVQVLQFDPDDGFNMSIDAETDGEFFTVFAVLKEPGSDYRLYRDDDINTAYENFLMFTQNPGDDEMSIGESYNHAINVAEIVAYDFTSEPDESTIDLIEGYLREKYQIPEIPVSGVSLSPLSIEFESVGEQETLTATIYPANASIQDLVWTSEFPTKVSILSDGDGLLTSTVTAEDNNNNLVIVTVTTIDGNFSDTCVIELPEYVVTGVTVQPNTLTLGVGETLPLSAIVVPDEAMNKNVVWSSDNDTVVTVDLDGFVTGVTEGTAEITVTTEDGGHTDVCSITVEIIPVVSVDLPDNELVKINETIELDVLVLPLNATDQTVTWSSDNESIITVDEDGIVTGHAIGTANIMVESNDGAFMDSCAVTVYEIGVDSVSVTPESANLSIGDQLTLTTEILPLNAANQNITWTSSNSAIASVDINGVVRAHSLGNVTITATTVEGSYTDTCEITVSDVQVTSVALAPETATVGVENMFETVTLLASISPVDADNQNVTWYSDDEAVATVHSGLVTGLTDGTVVITVVTQDGGFTDTSVVTVDGTSPSFVSNNLGSWSNYQYIRSGGVEFIFTEGLSSAAQDAVEQALASAVSGSITQDRFHWNAEGSILSVDRDSGGVFSSANDRFYVEVNNVDISDLYGNSNTVDLID